MDRYKEFFQNSMDSISVVLITSKGRFMIEEVNPAFEILFGISKQEIENTYIDEIKDEKTCEILLNKYRTCLDTGKTVTYERSFDIPTGHQYFSTVLSPIKNQAGNIRRIFAVTRVLNEEEKAQKDLDFFKQAIHSIHDAVYLIRSGSQIVYSNRAASKMLGYTNEELYLKNIFEIDTFIDKKTIDNLLYEKATTSKTTFEFETLHTRKNGSTLPVFIRLHYFQNEDVEYSFAIVKDIGEQKTLHTQLLQRKREYKSLADNIPMIIVRYDTKGSYLYVNTKHKEHILNKDIDFFVGKSIHEVFPDGRYSILEEAIHRVAKSGKEECFKKVSLAILKEKVEVHDINVLPEYDDDGNIISILVVGQDMTEAYHIQDELTKKEQELRVLAETTPGMLGSYHLKDDGTICMPYVSANIKELFGLTPDEVKKDATSLMQCTHPEDLQRIEESIIKSAKEMSAWHQKYRIIHPVKGERWMEANSKPISHPEGGVIWYGHAYDITEQKKREEELILTNSAMNTISEAIELIDPIDGSLYYVNDAACKMLGYSKEELIQMSIHDFVADDVTEEAIEKITQEIDKNGFIRFESRHRRRDGTILPVEVAAFWLGKKKKRFTLTVIQDISERKAYEKQIIKERDQYQAIFTNSLNGIVVLRNDFKILNINNAALTILGYLGVQMIPDNLLQLDVFDEVDKLKELVDNTIKYKTNQHITQKCINNNNRTTFLNINTVVQNENTILLFIQDITYNVLFEEQSLLANKGMMLDTIAHQWRQPLAEINSILFKINYTLQEIQNSDEIEEDLQKIEKITEHLSKTLDDFKGVLAKNEKKSSIKLKNLVDDVISLLGYSSKNIGVTITNNISGSIMIDIVEGLLKQVLFSILQNSFEAFKNSLEFNKYIVIDAFLSEEELIITIIDNAGGVKEIDHTKIFEKDYSSKKSGSGIGLYISNLIVSKIFKGKISAKNTTDGLETKIHIKV